MRGRSSIGLYWTRRYGSVQTWPRRGAISGELVPQIKLKKYGNGHKHDGPAGYKTRPARLLARAMAEVASKYRERGKARADAR